MEKEKKDKTKVASEDKVAPIKVKKKKNKIKKNITTGIAFVNATFNNTIVTIADDKRKCNCLVICRIKRI